MNSEEEKVIGRLRSPHATVAVDALRTIERWKQQRERRRRPASSEDFERALVVELARLASGGPPWSQELVHAVALRPCEELGEHFIRFLESDPAHILDYAVSWTPYGRAREAARTVARRLRDSSDPWTAYRAALQGARLHDSDERTYEIIADAVQKTGPTGIWPELYEVLEPDECARLNQVLSDRGMPLLELPKLHPSHPRARSRP